MSTLLVALPLGLSASAQDDRVRRSDVVSERRVALVIGNQAYSTIPLANPVQDARDIHAALAAAGFESDIVTDATQRQLHASVGRFIDRLQPGDVALVYYAGHGVQIGGENYLLPIDFDNSDEASAKYSSYPASLLHERMTERGARLKILVLDACRNNPFRSSRTTQRGLAAMAAPGRGTFIAFATGPGDTADDNVSGKNGLFTSALLEAMRQPGLDLEQLFSVVRRRVDALSNGRQTPWSNSSVVGAPFFFRTAPVAVSPLPVHPGPGRPAVTTPPDPPAGSTVSPAPSTASPRSLRWAYAHPSSGDDATWTPAIIDQVRTKLGLAMIFKADVAGVLWARPALDVSVVINAHARGAQAPSGISLGGSPRVAYAVLQTVVNESRIGKASIGQVQTLTASLATDLKDKQARLQALRDRFTAGSAASTERARVDLQMQIDTLQAEISKSEEAARASVQALQDRLQQQFLDVFSPLLAQLSANSALDFVFSGADSGFVYASSALDITPVLVRILDANEQVTRESVAISPVRQAAYVDLQRMASATVLGKSAGAQIQALQRKLGVEIQDKYSAVADLRKRLDLRRAAMDPAAIGQVEGDIRRAESEEQRVRQEAQTEASKLTAALQDDFQKKVTAVLEQFCRQRGIDIVLSVKDAGVIAAEPSLDITAEMIRALDLAHAK